MQLKINRPNIWPNLQDEKYVYVISPAYPNSPAEIDKITSFLKQWDLKPILFGFPSNHHEPLKMLQYHPTNLILGLETLD